SHFITDYYNNLDTYGDLNDDQNLDKLLHDTLQEDLLSQWDHEFDADRIKATITDRNLEGILNAIYCDYALGKGKTRWADKSDYLDRMHIINKIFPAARFIHIVRDGRDVANSVLKLPWGPKDLIGAAEWWNEYIRLACSVGAVLGPDKYTEVKYEDLVQEPERELKRLCEFVGEDFDESMLNYHLSSAVAIPEGRKAQHHNSDEPPKKSRTFAWKNEMTPTNVDMFSDYAKNSLASLGYEVPEKGKNGFPVKLAKMKIFVKRMLR
ncbi:MAG: hypothetical protein ACJAW1_003523, partial [Glaciecola sp.]